MFDLHTAFLEAQMATLLSRKRELQWMAGKGIRAARVANFGCHIGYETLALMWVLAASEAVGVDKDEGAICQARDTLIHVRGEIRRIGQMIRYYPACVSTDDRIWWDAIPIFFKEALLRPDCVTFLVADMTRSTALPSDWSDVSYCDFVLHHIWYDVSRQDPRGDTVLAIKEMARVAGPGGIVAARELVQYSDRRRLDFGALFAEAGLKPLWTEERAVDGSENGGVVGKYLYTRSTAEH